MNGKRSTKFYRKNESEVMERLGFKPTKNSGAGWVEKCDGENEHFICELKSTDKDSYSLKQSVLRTLEYHATVSHKTPVFALQFLNTNEVWVMISEEEYKAYMEFKRKQEKEDFFDFSVDKEEKEEYNNSIVKGNNKKSYLARKSYYEQKEVERMEKQIIEKEVKKEKRRNWKKSLNKKE